MEVKKEAFKRHRKWKDGKWQVSTWKRKMVFPARSDYDAEREVEQVRVCIQCSRMNRWTKRWTNQQIWCSPDDLGRLGALLDSTGDGGEEEGGDAP